MAMRTWFYKAPLLYLLSSMTVSLICFAITAAIDIRERRKRKKPDFIVPTKYLSTFSYLCIALGPISTLFGFVSFLPGLCLPVSHLRGPILYFQIATMECFQLSRLHYCFSKDQVHSDKGYPKWIFCALLFVLTMWLLSTLSLHCSWFPINCWIESDGTAVLKGVQLLPLESLPLESWIWMIPNGLYCTFEFSTISLYWYRVLSLRSVVCRKGEKGPVPGPVHGRILSILHRILILTYFYVAVNGLMVIVNYATTFAVEFGWINFNLSWIWTYSVSSLSISYSMFLMLCHNTSEYIAFLQFIKRSKCIWCFCCFGSMVNEQYRMLVDNVDNRTVEKMVSAPSLKDCVSPTYKNNTTGMELSIATRTEMNA